MQHEPTDPTTSPERPDETSPAAPADGAGGDAVVVEKEPDRLAEPVGGEMSPRLEFPVVGVGASAGGLEAYIEFLRACDPQAGIAYVLIQHLSPKHQSIMAKLLANHTTMRVLQVEDGIPVEPNHVYVIRPGYTMRIRDGRLHLGEGAAQPMHRRPVDDFFKSLAEEQRERAIAVILSGTGSNGTLGCEQIKAVGGFVIAQDPETAKFPAMPRSVIESNLADAILRAEEIFPRIRLYAAHAYSAGEPMSPEAMAARERQSLTEVISVLKARTRHDFGVYKKPTLVRRIQRRMSLVQVTSMLEYVRVLRQTPGEVVALADDLMIHVTGFFRDPEVWETLKKRVIEPMVGEKPDGSAIRVWVTACSSGEEAYTVGMLLLEAADAAGKRFDVKIFATDTAERSLSQARAGVFPGGIEGEITPERLARFFERDEAFYRVKKELREMVVFAPQNVLQDPPFSRLDLCTCRNLLIYIEPETQRRILSMLHFGLREGGALVLGNSETITGAEDLFEPIDKPLRIYRRVGATRHGALEFPLPSVALSRRAQSQLSGEGVGDEPQAQPRATVSQLAVRALLDEHTPAAVVIDRTAQVVYYHGATHEFLMHPSGEPTRDLLSLARDEVRGAVRAAVGKALSTNERVRHRDGTVGEGDDRERIEVGVTPLGRDPVSQYFLVSFRRYADPPPMAADPDPTHGTQMAEELRRVRDELQSTIEELQTSNEEMKASHEETTSVNEELQSTNEELETSKEELQSLNEELTTVNAQLQAKMEELERTTNDLASLLSSTDIAVVFLDTSFRIRRFTPATRALIDLIPGDAGRPLRDLAQKFDDPTLIPDAQAVLDRLVPAEREMSGHDGRHYVRRVLPYRTADNRIEGVVVTFIDVTERLRAERALRESQAWLAAQKEAFQAAVSGRPLAESLGALVRAAVEQVGGEARAAFYAVSPDGKGLAHVIGMSDDYARAINELKTGPESLACRLSMGTGEPVVTEDVDREPRWEPWRALARSHGYRACWSFPVQADGDPALGTFALYFSEPRRPTARELELAGVIARAAAIVVSRQNDVAERAAVEAALRASEARFRAVADVVPEMLWQVDARGDPLWHNQRWTDYTGQTVEQSRERGWLEPIHPDDRAETKAGFDRSLATGEPWRREHRVRDVATGAYRWFLVQGVPQRDESRAILSWFGSLTDVHDQRMATVELSESEGQLRSVMENALDFAILLMDDRGTITQWNAGATAIMGWTDAEAVGRPGATIFTPEDRAAAAPDREMTTALRDGRAPDERWHLRKDGTRFWGSGVMSVVRDEAGRHRGFVKVLRDVTARREAEEDRARLLAAERAARERAEAASRAKDDFLATLSHELRTPLSAILIWTKLLRTLVAGGEPQAAEGLDAIEQSANAQRRLIDDLLDTARITSGKLRLETVPVDLADVVAPVVESVRPTATLKGVALAADFRPDVGAIVADPERVRQVAWNLLTNAVKFTPAGGRVDVTVARGEGPHVVLRVADTGRGVAPDFLPYLFDRFRQEDDHAATGRRAGGAGGGLGLGLSIVRDLVELHGGTVAAESAGPDKGSTFTVTFPLPR